MALAVLHAHQLRAKLAGRRVLTSRKQARPGVLGPRGALTWSCARPRLCSAEGVLGVAPGLLCSQGSRAFTQA